MKRQALTAILTIFLLTAGTALAAGDIVISSGSVQFNTGGEAAVLTVSGPQGFDYRQDLDAGAVASMSLFDDKGNHLADGTYKWQVTEVKEQSSEKRSGYAAPSEPISGVFTIKNGAVANPDALEGGLDKAQVFATDLIVEGSACVGIDCTSTENFSFDTLRLKENNLRIKFDDTSGSASFPNNDWQLTANDSTNGGSNKFSIDDITGGKTPFTVEAGAPNHALFVESTGDVGIGTSTPVVEAHITDGDSPTLRLEQDGSSGFTPQTWDLAGNETNFFIRDVTNGSKLPFRIKPQAPTDSLFVNSNGDIGLGTENPKAPLHVLDSGSVFTPLAGTAALFQNNANATDNVFVSLMAGSEGNAQLSFGDADGQFAARDRLREQHRCHGPARRKQHAVPDQRRGPDHDRRRHRLRPDHHQHRRGVDQRRRVAERVAPRRQDQHRARSTPRPRWRPSPPSSR